MDVDLRGSLEHAIKDLEVPAFVVGLHRTITIANEKASSLLLESQCHVLVGTDLSDILCPAAISAVSSWIDEVVEGIATQVKLGITLSLNTGPELWSVVSLKDRDDRLTGFLFQQVLITSALPDQSILDAFNNPTAAADLDDLARRELRWKTAVLSANQGVWDHDFELDRHFLSDTWREIRGISIGAAAAETTEDWLKTIHPDDVGRVKEQVALQESGATDVVNYTFRQRHADGHWIWILSRGRVVRRDENGLPVRIIGTDTDISDLKFVELERARLAERLGLAIEAAEMGQWEQRIETKNAIWDDRSLKMFGLRDNLTLRSETDWSKMIHPDDRDATMAHFHSCQLEKRDIACDFRIMTADGIEKFIRTRGKFVHDVEGGDRYIGVNLDLTKDHQKTVALEQARNRLEYESRHDPLTGLANRRRLDEVFLVQSSENESDLMGAMHLDIDRFKQINDNFGHDAGDFTLKHAASIMKKYLPKDVLVARVGGDEFVALFPQAQNRVVMEALAEQIIQAFSMPFFYNKIRIKAGISIGIAALDRQEQSESSLLILADIALYHAKKSGRGIWQFYEPHMKTQTSERIKIQDALISAFEHNEITCHYQPQFDAQTMKLSGIEALVRWESPTSGLIMPDQFLSAAEDMGLIAKLDELVLCQVLTDLECWEAEGLSVPHISVNVSAHRISDPDLGTWLQRMKLPPGKIVFELLESVFLDGEDATISANLSLLQSMGVDVEIDDFGTGHASIISLLRISPKRLKIDRELVEPIVHSPKRRGLLETIIRIGKMLDIEVVAEGVETNAHIAILRELQCDYLQGFALSKPMNSANMRELLIARR